MTSYERVMISLEHGIPDRVPFAEFYINGSFVHKNFKNCSYLEFLDQVGIDVVLVSSPKSALKKLDKNTYQDSWGVIYKDTGEESLIEYISPISSKGQLRSYRPPDPSEDPKLAELERIVGQVKNNKAIVFPISDSFSKPRVLLGLEKLLISYIDDPELVKTLAEMSIDYHEKLMEMAVEIGADIFISSDDYAGNLGPLIGPAHFEQFILPGLTRLVEKAHNLGAKYVKHTDGNIDSLLTLIISSGIDGLHPIEECAGMDILRVKKEYGKSICIIGSVDCRNTLCTGSEEEVLAEVKHQISTLAPGGGYMISSSNSIHSGVKANNFMTMVRAIKKYGKYPTNHIKEIKS